TPGQIVTSSPLAGTAAPVPAAQLVADQVVAAQVFVVRANRGAASANAGSSSTNPARVTKNDRKYLFLFILLQTLVTRRRRRILAFRQRCHHAALDVRIVRCAGTDRLVAGGRGDPVDADVAVRLGGVERLAAHGDRKRRQR